MLIYIFIIVILVLILYAVPTDDDIRYKINDIINNKIFGEHLDNNVLNVIKKINKIKNKNIDDYSNLGMLYSCHLNNHIKAYNNYLKTLNLIQNSKVNENNAIDIMYKIENIINRKIAKASKAKDDHVFPAKLRQKLLPMLNAIQELNHKKIINNTISSKLSKREKKNISKEIEKNKIWKSDPQNVHDSVILYDLKSQFLYIKSQNDIIQHPNYTFEQVCYSVLNYPNLNSLQKNSEANLLRVLERIRVNNKVIGLDICEQTFFTEIWRRIQSPANNVNRKELEISFIQSLQDCIENGNIVCSTGRNTRLISSLAYLDKESESKGIGILKSKESIRNRILEESAKIIKKYIGDSTSEGKMGIPKYVIDHYNEGRVTKKVKELEENMRKNILCLKDTFTNQGLDNKKIDQILDECISVI